MTEADRIEAVILHLAETRGADRSISPEDAARAAARDGTDWHLMLHPVRHAVHRLALAGRIDILRKGKPVPPAEARGVVRLRLRPPSDPLSGIVPAPSLPPAPLRTP